MSADRFLSTVATLRVRARRALTTVAWADLDRTHALTLLQGLRSDGHLDADGYVAMVARLGQEEGTTDVSALSFCINLAKGDTPMERIEVLGGLHRVVEAEGEAVRRTGGRVLTEAPVQAVVVEGGGVRVAYHHQGQPCEERFDAAVLAVAPEHLSRIEVRGSSLPLGAVAGLRPAAITKTNLVVRRAPPPSERSTASYALWFSPVHEADGGLTRLTFFHGYEGAPILEVGDMLEAAYGDRDLGGVVSVDSRRWQAHGRALSHGYTTIPAPGQALAVVRLAVEQFFEGRYDRERLWIANHAVGLGCYTRDAALAGEWAAVSLMRAYGLDVGAALSRVARPMDELTGLDHPSARGRTG
jgi:hypothetical protein